MKTKLLFLLIAVLFSSTLNLLGQEQGENDPNIGSITVEQYCTFLNAVAASDSQQLDQATNYLIARSGEPGNYYYEVANGCRLEAADPDKDTASQNSTGTYRESATDAPMLFLSWSDAERYCNWKNAYLPFTTFHLLCNCEAATIDPLLKSNLLTFRLDSTALCKVSGPEIVRPLLNEILENVFKVVLGFGVVGGGTARPEAERTNILMEGGYLFPQEHGCTYHGVCYTGHALERMAPNTPEMIELLTKRTLKKAEAEGFEISESRLKIWQEQVSDLQEWWKENFPQPRAIWPSTVEAEIANPGSTDINVITSQEGKVITVYPTSFKKGSSLSKKEKRELEESTLYLKFLLEMELEDEENEKIIQFIKKAKQEVELATRKAEAVRDRGNKKATLVQERIVEAQYGALSLYKWAIHAEEREGEAEAYFKGSQAYQEEALAWIRGDEVTAYQQRKIAEAQDNIALCFKQAVEAESEKASDVFLKSLSTWNQHVDALIENFRGGSPQEEVAKAFYNAALAYEKNDLFQENGNTTTLEALLKSAEAYEQLAEALARGDGKKKIGAQRRIAEGQNNIACFNEQALQAQKEGAFERSETCLNIINVYKQQIETLECKIKASGGNANSRKATNLQQRIIDVQHNAIWYYERVIEAQEKEDLQTEEACRACAKAYEQEAKALVLGDEAAVASCETIIGMYARVIEIYSQNAMTDENHVKALVKKVAANSFTKTSLVQGGALSPYFFKKILSAQRGALSSYKQAIKAEEKKDNQIAEIFHGSAYSREQGVDALVQGDNKRAIFFERMGWAQYVTAFAYQRVAEAQEEGENATVVEAFLKSAQARECRVEALRRGNQQEEKLQKEIAETEYDLAWSYKQAHEAEEKKDTQAAEAYFKEAEVYEQQVQELHARYFKLENERLENERNYDFNDFRLFRTRSRLGRQQY